MLFQCLPMVVALLSGSVAAAATLIILDKFHCKPEVMESQSSYYCNSEGDVVCLPGYSDPDNLCRTPLCVQDCVHGFCASPNNCLCEIGWGGRDCNCCVRKPGCVEGYCTTAMGCVCHDGFTGDLCDIPVCVNNPCVNGRCVDVDRCRCYDGWEGASCDECRKRPGCKNGDCKEGNDCSCHEGYKGSLCDKPVCQNGFNESNGVCVAPNLPTCHPGWQGDDCNTCVKPANCPNGHGCITDPSECVSLSAAAATTATTTTVVT